MSLAEDIVVQAVPELPLLSEELDALPSPRVNEDPTCRPADESIRHHFRLVPFELDMKGTEKSEELSRKVVSVQHSALLPPTCIELPKILNAFEE